MRNSKKVGRKLLSELEAEDETSSATGPSELADHLIDLVTGGDDGSSSWLDAWGKWPKSWGQ